VETGRTSIPAGEEITLMEYPDGESPKRQDLEWTISDPGEPAKLTQHLGWSSEGNPMWSVEELTGNTSVEIEWEAIRK
jgi:hypothetical protein